ncbi:hypothetical protein BDW71DRAFT_86364 [Aspergillus fruticulosus]
MQLYLEGKASPLVLQTVFFWGFTVGPDNFIRNRTTARKTHYLHAKALYDTDHEENPLKVVASLLLFGFWWLGSEDQTDIFYWVGCCYERCAGTSGAPIIYRLGPGFCTRVLTTQSSSQPGMSREERSLRKRI